MIFGLASSKLTRVPRLAAAFGRCHGSIMNKYSARRFISTFHIDNTPRGKLQPYMGAIKLISLVSGSVVASIMGLYVAMNYYLDSTYPVSALIERKETRKLLRGAAMREHLVPNPQIAYVFLLRALEQIYADKQLSEDSAEVQEIVVRLASAASKMGEREPAERMLEDCWAKIADNQGELKNEEYEGVWQRQQICRIAQVLGPLVTEKGDFDRALQIYGVALQASRQLDNSQVDIKERDRLRAQTAGFVASLGENFALKGDFESASVLLQGLLAEIRDRNQLVTKESSKKIDQWTCLDAVVMLDLAQVFGQQGKNEESEAWTNSALAATTRHEGVRACDNCYTHSIYHLGTLAEKTGKVDDALIMYRKA
ncbi:hypothetical protein J3B02_003329, partial [Coemansia erecta]